MQINLNSHEKKVKEGFHKIWFIWKHHNYVVFDNDRYLTRTHLDMLKCKVWSWIKSKAKGFLSLIYLEWLYM